MTTDITKLAQRARINAECGEHLSPAETIDLVEALEKAQAQSSKWLEAYHKAVKIGARYEERIAELESHTVKLPKKNIGWDRDEDDCWNNAIDACTEALTAAGIKLEAE